MTITADELQAILAKSFPNSSIEITDLAGDNDHYEARIVSPLFTGKNRVQQHKMVHAALENTKAKGLHALALKTSIS